MAYRFDQSQMQTTSCLAITQILMSRCTDPGQNTVPVPRHLPHAPWRAAPHGRPGRVTQRNRHPQNTARVPLQGSRSDSSCSQHLPRARDLARLSRKSSRFKSSRRTLTRDTSARDWTSSDAAAQAASGTLPAGFQRHTVTLPATVAIEPCNKTIPVTLLWHESMLPGGLAQHPPPVATAATDTATATDTGVTPTQVPTAAPEAGEGAGGAQEGVRKLPVVIWLHATGQCATDMVPRMEVFARHGFLTVAVDARYHGERTDPCSSCAPREQYENAVYRCVPARVTRVHLLLHACWYSGCPCSSACEWRACAACAASPERVARCT